MPLLLGITFALNIVSEYFLSAAQKENGDRLMRRMIRHGWDKTFTALAVTSIVLLGVVLLTILAPMVHRGISAVFFTDTVAFDQMQLDLFGRGNADEIQEALDRAGPSRAVVYDTIDAFKKNLDTEALIDTVKAAYRQYGRDLRDKDIQADPYRQLRSDARDIRDNLTAALAGDDKNDIHHRIAEVLSHVVPMNALPVRPWRRCSTSPNSSRRPSSKST